MSNKLTTIFLLLGANNFYGNPPIGRTMLVKQVYLVEQLRPAYELCMRTFDFYRFKRGPYSDAIFFQLNQLIFSGLVSLPEFRLQGSRIEATYGVTSSGISLYQRFSAKPSNAKLNSLCKDMVWALQSFGVQTAKQIIEIVYQEPEFAKVSDESTRLGIPMEDRVALSKPTSPDHPSFRVQAILKQLGNKKLGAQFTPRELVRAYLLTLAMQNRRTGTPNIEQAI